MHLFLKVIEQRNKQMPLSHLLSLAAFLTTFLFLILYSNESSAADQLLMSQHRVDLNPQVIEKIKHIHEVSDGEVSNQIEHERSVISLPWLSHIFDREDDPDGVLHSLEARASNWNYDDRMESRWGQEGGAPHFNQQTTKEKARLIGRSSIKYLDRRLINNIKKAKVGSTLKTVKSINTALRPKTSVSLFKSVEVKFGAKILQGKGTLTVKNPWVNAEANINYRGHYDVNIGYFIVAIDTNARLNYDSNVKKVAAILEKTVAKNLYARVSSQHVGNMLIHQNFDYGHTEINKNDSRIELSYQKDF
jgi:hypothetical protein